MGLSLKPSDAVRPSLIRPTNDEIIEAALATIHTQGALTSMMSMRHDDADKLIVHELRDCYGLASNSETMRFSLHGFGAIALPGGSTTSALLGVLSDLGKDRRQRTLSDDAIEQLRDEIITFRKMGSSGEQRAIEKVRRAESRIDRWDDDFWRGYMLGRIEREIRPLLKDEPQQRPRVVAMPQDVK